MLVVFDVSEERGVGSPHLDVAGAVGLLWAHTVVPPVRPIGFRRKHIQTSVRMKKQTAKGPRRGVISPHKHR